MPARIVVHTDARLKPLGLGNLRIVVRLTAPSKLYWAGRPAMRVVQALHWLKDRLAADRSHVQKRLAAIFADPTHGPAILADLREGFAALPDWMRIFLKDMLAESPKGSPDGSATPNRRKAKVRDGGRG